MPEIRVPSFCGGCCIVYVVFVLTALIFKVAAVYSGTKFTHKKIPFGEAPCIIESGACAHTHTHRNREEVKRRKKK
jgi:hypothetical protein